MTPFIIGCALILAAYIVLMLAIFVTYMIGAYLAHTPVRRRRKNDKGELRNGKKHE